MHWNETIELNAFWTQKAYVSDFVSGEKWTLLRFTLERKKKDAKMDAFTLLRFTLLRFYALGSYAKSEKTQNTVSRTRLG